MFGVIYDLNTVLPEVSTPKEIPKNKHQILCIKKSTINKYTPQVEHETQKW